MFRPAQYTQTVYHAPRSWFDLILLALLAVFLLGVGVLGVHTGWQAISQQHYDLEWRPGRSGPWRTDTLNGAEAVRFGIGSLAMGCMFSIWGIGVATFIRRQNTATELSRLGRARAAIALVALVVTVVCFYPPWQLWSFPLYTVITVINAMVFLLPAETCRRWFRIVFSGLIVTAISAGWLNQHEIADRIVVGILTSLGIVVHLFAVCPSLVRDSERTIDGTPQK